MWHASKIQDRFFVEGFEASQACNTAHKLQKVRNKRCFLNSDISKILGSPFSPEQTMPVAMTTARKHAKQQQQIRFPKMTSLAGRLHSEKQKHRFLKMGSLAGKLHSEKNSFWKWVPLRGDYTARKTKGFWKSVPQLGDYTARNTKNMFLIMSSLAGRLHSEKNKQVS